MMKKMIKKMRCAFSEVLYVVLLHSKYTDF